MEGEGLLEVEVHRLGVVMVVADRDVLARLEVEVVPALADHHRTLDAGGPHDRATQDLAEVVEHEHPPVLGRLDHAGVLVGAEREPVGALDARVEQGLDGAGHVARITGVVTREGDGVMRRRRGHPDDPGCIPTVEDRDVLRPGDLAGRLSQPVQVDVGGTTVGRQQLVPVDREGGPELDERQHPAPLGREPRDRSGAEVVGATEVAGRVVPAERPFELDQLARRERGDQLATALVVDRLPPGVGDGRVAPQQMVHRATSLRLPIPREPEDGGGDSGAPPSASASTSVTGTVVKR